MPSSTSRAGCDVDRRRRDRGIPAAVAAARAADVAIVVVGDRAGLFGRGTVGEGNDVDDLELPGPQRRLVEEVVGTGVPTIVVVLSGRPYAIGWALAGPLRPRGCRQAFFPGEEGGSSDRGDPLGSHGSLGAASRLAAPLGGRAAVHLPASDPGRPVRDHQRRQQPGAAVRAWADVHDIRALPPARHPPSRRRARTSRSAVDVRNTGTRAGVDVVQLYARDVYASVTRPVAQLVGYARVALEAGERVVVQFHVPSARLAFADRRGVRIVEAGDIELWVGGSCDERETHGDDAPHRADSRGDGG